MACWAAEVMEATREAMEAATEVLARTNREDICPHLNHNTLLVYHLLVLMEGVMVMVSLDLIKAVTMADIMATMGVMDVMVATAATGIIATTVTTAMAAAGGRTSWRLQGPNWEEQVRIVLDAVISGHASGYWLGFWSVVDSMIPRSSAGRLAPWFLLNTCMTA